jgi:hypothetical protein
MNEKTEEIEEKASERENADQISRGDSDVSMQAMSLAQIDDSELPQSVKDCLKGEKER